MCRFLFVRELNDYQQRQSARIDLLESGSVFGVTFCFCTMADCGIALYQDCLYPKQADEAYALFCACNDLFYTAH